MFITCAEVTADSIAPSDTVYILHIFNVTYLKSLLDCAIVCNVFAKCLETIKLKTLKIKNRL